MYDPGEWGVDELYLYIISDGSITKAARRKRAPPVKDSVPAPDGDACRTCGRKPPTPAELSAAHADLVAALQAEFFADDLQPPPSAERWSYEALRAYFESGGLQVPPDASTP